MNPLTLVKRIQKINTREADLGISEDASWHAKYKDSAYVFVGGIPYDLSEGDLLAVFAQYGEVVDVNLVRDKATGKSKGFAFLAYEDQRSTNLAVDNLNGAQILGRIIRVDHVTKYKKKEEEDEETERQKREERGVCRAFQKGECNRGASCKFSHDEQRAADTGWGPEEDRRSRWTHDKFDDRSRDEKRSGDVPPSRAFERQKADDHDSRRSRRNDDKQSDHNRLEMKEKDRVGERERRGVDKRLPRYEDESSLREDYDRREEKRSRRHERDSDQRGNQEGRERTQDERERPKIREERDKEREREREKRSAHSRDLSSQRYRDREDDHRRDRYDDDYRSSRK